MGKKEQKARTATRGGAPSMIDVARIAGVSKMTVSRALRGDGYVSDEARRKVRAAIEETGYVTDGVAASLASGRSGFVAVVIPSIDNSNFSQTVRGISNVLERAGMQILLADTDYDVEKEETLIRTLLRRRPEGIILTGGAHTKAARRLLQQSAIPIVEMWDLPHQPIGDAVGFSHRKASKEMVKYLVDKGHRHLAFIGGATSRDTRGSDRRRGFLEAVRELGLPEGKIITFGDPPITVEQGASAISELLDRHPHTDAALCVSDLSAFGAIMECRRRGIDVPNDLAITGFGDFEISKACFPSITTIGCDCDALGRHAAERIIDHLSAIDAAEPASQSTVLVDYKIISRDSG